MVERSPLDPFGLIAELASQIEKAGNRYGSEVVGSADFSAALNRALVVGLGVKKLNGDALRQMQLLFNVASHDDIVAITEKLQAIDDKLLAMTQVLERLDRQNMPAQNATPRTRKPPEPAPAVLPPPALPSADVPRPEPDQAGRGRRGKKAS